MLLPCAFGGPGMVALWEQPALHGDSSGWMSVTDCLRVTLHCATSGVSPSKKKDKSKMEEKQNSNQKGLLLELEETKKIHQ